MKLLSIRLCNYIGIANGTGLKELYIDFSGCKPIIAVVGHNGSGKSTLLKSLHPFPDSYDMLIPNCEAYKEIKYFKDNHLYEIKIHYIHMDNKNNTEVAVFKDNVNLNPNLNVTNAKDIIMNEFELDSNYISLSQLSSEDRGLADKRPSERKKFVNDILTNLTVYNNMYKALNKKSSTFKNLINNLSYKINSIGGDNLPLFESNLASLEKNLDSLEKAKEKAISKQTTIANAIELNNEISKECITIKDRYVKALASHSDILNRISELKIESEKIADSHFTDTIILIEPKDITFIGSETKKHIESDLAAITAELNSKLELNAKFQAKCQDLINAKSEKEVKLKTLKTNGVEIESFIDYRDKAKLNRDKFKKDKNLSNNLLECKYSSEAIERLYDELCEINASLYQNVYYTQESDLKKYGTAEEIQDKLKQLDLNLEGLKLSREVENSKLNSKTNFSNIEFLDDIPCDCDNKECYYCRAKQQYLLMKDDIDKHSYILKDIDNRIEKMTNEIEKLKDYSNEANTLTRYLKFKERNKDILVEVLYKVSITPYIYNKNCVLDSNNIKEIIQTTLDKYNMLDTYKALDAEYLKLMDTCAQMSDKINLIKTLEKEIKDIDVLINESETMIIDPVVIETFETQKNIFTDELNFIDRFINLGKEFDIIVQELLVSKAEFDKHEDTIKQIVALSVKKGEVDKNLQELNEKLKNVKDEYDTVKYNIRLLTEYKREYDIYANDYQKIETVKKFTSPTTGIQTLFMETYMNNVLIVANQLLALMFNGEFVLQPFIINETEFRIPCAGSGYLNDDISSMSASQICMISMIISFAMLYNSSSCYNILKLDEIDAALDNENRIKFVEMLDQIMNIMHCEQCFIISHNMELDESQVTKIDMNSFKSYSYHS